MRNQLSALFLCAFFFFTACFKRPSPTSVVPERFVIIGVDGLDPSHVRRLIAQKALPHMEALARIQGGVVDLRTTQPPQSPVAWASFATGLSPGHHGVVDFVDRDPHTYRPRMATGSVEHAHLGAEGMKLEGSVVSFVKGDFFWDRVARKGIPATVLQVPYAYPCATDGAVCVPGLGVPDVRGTFSSFTWFVSEPFDVPQQTLAGGRKVLLQHTAHNVWQGMLEGPALPSAEGVEMLREVVRFEVEGNAMQVHVQGHTYGMKQGASSPYVQVFFTASNGAKVWASTRFTWLHTKVGVEVYAEPLGVSPQKPYFVYAHPPSFGETLWKQQGPFKTVGWQDDTNALEAHAMTEEQFVRESYEHMALTQKALMHTLRTQQKGLVVAVFTSLDRIGHMFSAQIRSPKNTFSSVLDAQYQKADAYVGEVMRALSPKDVLLVMSDHGYGTFDRQFHVNTWLVEQGYMVLQKGHTEPGTAFEHVDWPHTRAYALGTGSVYVNTQGREGMGIVPPQEVPTWVQTLVHAFEHVRDGDVLPVVRAYQGDVVFAGPQRFQSPDIRLALRDGYRVSWATSLGGGGKAVFENNTQHWSGDHASADAEQVPGVLLCNRKLVMSAPKIEDIAATVLHHYRVPGPQGASGRVLFNPSAAHTKEVQHVPQ